MLTQRPLHPDIKKLLLDNTPFQYAHLVKFERPSRPDNSSGVVSTSAQRYTYLTDASRDVEFDDKSKSQLGVPNGTQTYVANKVLKMTAVSEDTEAKASSFSLTLDGNGLGAAVSSLITISNVSAGVWDLTASTATNILRAGFREGDKIKLTGDVTASVNIRKFLGPNKIRVSKIDDNLTPTTGNITLSLASEEIMSILLDKNASNYSSFINREVFIYRAYFANGVTVGEPFLLFKGIISAVGFDDSDTALNVTWTLTSHWGDFAQVKGRITSDDFHRALDQNGVPQPASALKVSYAYDKGFSHAETSINILATYSVQVEKQDVKAKNGFLGIGSKVKVKKYFVNEDRNTELDFQLQAKSIPVIYGVRTTPGLPVFADTLNDDSSTVYVVQALGEGEMGGIYDAYIDGNSLICNDKADFDARSTQTSDETVKLICRGRSDRGDVLGGISSVSTTYNDFYDTYYSNPALTYRATLDYDLNYAYAYPSYIEPVTATANYTGAGIVDGQSINLSSPQNITLDYFSGKPGQRAASSLVSIAKANNFKVQNSYWNGIDTADYWGPNHRLLDTAYIVSKFKIEEGETSIPTIEYVVRGKVVECYNYDKSYSHYSKATGESPTNFALGDAVALKDMAGNTLAASVQIIDKWTFANADGSLNTRFRFSIDPALGYVNSVPTITKFQMVSGGNTWTMITYNHKETEGTCDKEYIFPITSAVNSNGFVRLGFGSGVVQTAGGEPGEASSIFSVSDAQGYPTDNAFFGNAALVGTLTPTTLTTRYAWSVAGPAATQTVARYLVQRNIVKLPTGASTENNFYNGATITLTRIDAVTNKKTVQVKRIINHVGSIATIEGMWDYGFHPKPGDIIAITPSYADSRISINPAVQLMDYVCSPTYGRGLDPKIDLNFPSWLETARKCDTQSNVTVQLSNAANPTPGAKYRYPANGPLIWQGDVVGVDNGYVEFTNVIGKLTNAWNSWKNYAVNELIYQDQNLYQVTSAGVKTAKPGHTSGTVGGLLYISSLSLSFINGNGPATLSLVTNGNPVRAIRDGSTVPGYSLYDCDGVDYWRLLGWDEFSQRYVTQHQTNIIIDTALPLFDNVNSFLQHFGALMRYSGGQYYLDLEEAEGAIQNTSNEARNITSDHIIEKIRLTDEGIRSAFNSLTAAYPDPANKFESRNISFFNSDYLKADRGVAKKGNLTVPGISNYYNTRILADRYLNKSRFGLTISFNMAPRGTILLAGMVIQLQYPRYGWEDKKFRITTLTHQSDASVDIVAEEYDDSFYGLSRISKQAASGLSGGTAIITSIGSPTGLRASGIESDDEQVSGVEITWVNNPVANTKNVSTELYSSFSEYLNINVTSISGNVITTSQNPHNLKAGEIITGLDSLNGLQAGRTYFIKEITGPNTFTLSDTKDGLIRSLSNGASINALMQTANLTATIPCPANSYVDVFGGIDGRIVKYYWVRHKVIQG